MSADLWAPGAVQPQPDPTSLGWLEIALPIWHHKFKVLLGGLLGGLLAFGVSLLQPVEYSARASFVVQPALRPSQAGVANAVPAIAGLIGGGSPIDMHVAILRSRELNERIVERFDLVRVWELANVEFALRKLSRKIEFGIGRREGMVSIDVSDASPQRAAAMANEYVEELRNALRRMTHEEAQQRRRFFDEQLVLARKSLAEAQQKLQASGFDLAALSTDPRAAAESLGRLQAELATTELQLAAMRRVRTDESSEVRQLQSRLAALRAQMSRQASQRDPQQAGRGDYIDRVRDYRYAEALAESMARQAEAARVDASSEPLPLQWLDRARVASLPSSPIPLRWAAVGLLAGWLIVALTVIQRHRNALRRLDPGFQRRLALLRDLLARRSA